MAILPGLTILFALSITITQAQASLLPVQRCNITKLHHGNVISKDNFFAQDVRAFTLASSESPHSMEEIRAVVGSQQKLTDDTATFARTVYLTNGTCYIIAAGVFKYNAILLRLEPENIVLGPPELYLYFLGGTLQSGFLLYVEVFKNKTWEYSSFDIVSPDPSIKVDKQEAKRLMSTICDFEVDVDTFFYDYPVDPRLDGSCP